MYDEKFSCYNPRITIDSDIAIRMIKKKIWCMIIGLPSTIEAPEPGVRERHNVRLSPMTEIVS
jgi:hypothetical protein